MSDDPFDPDCFTCRRSADPDPPLHERILLSEHWRVAHALGTTFPGWLVVVPHQHALALTDLPSDGAAELGTVLQKVSGALAEVTACERTYLALFAEAPDYPHLHVHVVPRLADHPEELKGPAVFTALQRPEREHLTGAGMDIVAAQLVDALAASP